MSPLIAEPSTSSPSDQIETIHSMCDWWKTRNLDVEHMPDICHWFIQPQQNIFNIDEMSSKSHFTPFGHLSSQDQPDLHPSHHSSSVSLMLILGGVFIILFITAVITCIKQKRGAQVTVNIVLWETLALLFGSHGMRKLSWIQESPTILGEWILQAYL